MIMRWPGKVEPGQVNRDLVYSIDICATVLEAAGITPPVPLHGKSLFSLAVKKREYVFAARDKMDDSHDAMRSIRSRQHKLILNLMPERAYCQFSRYKESAYPPLAEMNVLNLEGKLTAEQASFMAPNKPEIELFDLREDPHEVHNLAADPAHADLKAKMLAELENWRKQVIDDQGVSAEFRAIGRFPEKCPTPTVGEWVEQNAEDYNFSKSGSPGWYPTRTLEEWRKARDSGCRMFSGHLTRKFPARKSRSRRSRRKSSRRNRNRRKRMPAEHFPDLTAARLPERAWTPGPWHWPKSRLTSCSRLGFDAARGGELESDQRPETRADA